MAESERHMPDSVSEHDEGADAAQHREQAESSGAASSAANAQRSTDPGKARYEDQRSQSGNGWTGLVQDARSWLLKRQLAVWVSGSVAVINIVFLLWRVLFRIPQDSLYFSTTYDQLLMTGGHIANGAVSPQPPSVTLQMIGLIATLFISTSTYRLIMDVIIIFTILAIAEPRLGRRRTLLACLISGMSGAVIGLFLCLFINWLGGMWQNASHARMTMSPLVMIFGALMAASAFSSFIWRRRIRLIGYMAVLIALLYTGDPGDYCLLVAALVGQFIGYVWHGPQDSREHWASSSAHERRSLLSSISVVLSLGPIVATVSHAHRGALSALGLLTGPGTINDARLMACLRTASKSSCYQEFNLYHISTSGSIIRAILPTIVLLIISWGMYRGRRVAAWSAIIVNSGIVLFSFLYYLLSSVQNDMVAFQAYRHGLLPSMLMTVLPPLAFAIVIRHNIRLFNVPTERGALWRGLSAIIATALALSAFYLGFGLLNPTSFLPHAHWSSLLSQLPQTFIPMGFLNTSQAVLRTTTFAAELVRQCIGIIFWLVLIVVVSRWMRTSVAENAGERKLAGSLVELGGESMSFMTTWEGNRYWFSPTGRSSVAYRVSHGIALTTTGPFGDPGEYLDDLQGFTHFCYEHSLSPVFYSVHDATRQALLDQGWSSIQVGSEMVVDPRLWQTKGKKWQAIRTAINKANREGIRDVYADFSGSPREIQSQIVDISEQWANLKSLPEMKFTLGGIDELRDPRVMMLYAIDADNVVQGVTSWLPTWRNGQIVGWTLDFMRHRIDSPNGIMEFLIARMAQRLKEGGTAEFMSLSAAPLAGSPVDDGEDSAALHHALQIVADIMEPSYGFNSLFQFKKRFQPHEEPVYICYPDGSRLLPMGLAVLEAYLPDLKPSQIRNMLNH
ncbi:MAG: DUF2156 domain-containing protein [Bifidobacterium sp.]